MDGEGEGGGGGGGGGVRGKQNAVLLGKGVVIITMKLLLLTELYWK